MYYQCSEQDSDSHHWVTSNFCVVGMWKQHDHFSWLEFSLNNELLFRKHRNLSLQRLPHVDNDKVSALYLCQRRKTNVHGWFVTEPSSGNRGRGLFPRGGVSLRCVRWLAVWGRSSLPSNNVNNGGASHTILNSYWVFTIYASIFFAFRDSPYLLLAVHDLPANFMHSIFVLFIIPAFDIYSFLNQCL